jgi:group I intron endonuclease
MAVLPKKPGVYKIVNTDNNKLYIGCASDIRARVNGHLYDLRRRKHANSYLQKAWLKYGEQAFTFEIVELCNKSEIYIREHYWVTTLNVFDRNLGYNLKPTDVTRKVGHSEETLQKLRIANKGKTPSKLCIQKLRERKISDEHKEVLRLSRTNVDWYALRQDKAKKVIDTKTGEIYNSLTQAANHLGMTKWKLSKYLLGTRTNKTNLKYI